MIRYKLLNVINKGGKKLKTFKKYMILGLTFVLIGASISISATSKINILQDEIQNSSFSGRGWSDDFSSYTLGQFLDGGTDDGGWKGWDDNPVYGAYVVDDQELSVPHSVEIAGDSDLVHEYTGYTTGQWTYIAWQYIPSDFVGETGFMLLNTYEDDGEKSWSTQLRFNADSGVVVSNPEGSELWLVYDEWVEIRVEIDLDADIQKIYYDESLLVEKSWKDGVTGGGVANIASVDLFANYATAVYYDDMSLSGEGLIPLICCDGELSWSNIVPGTTVFGDFEISNCGDSGSELDWEVSEWPEDWGNYWTFEPENGLDLTPEMGVMVITVEVIAPLEENKEFTGKIKVINTNNPSDYCEVEVYLKTPRNKAITNPIINFIKNNQNLFPIMQKLLERFGL